MARPLSEEKRAAILAAAVDVIAEQGLSAATAKIAKVAGVAEGSLFTYFPTKDDLLNRLYLALKAELGDQMLSAYPKRANLKARVRHIWRQYIDWGVLYPNKWKTLSHLSLSDRVSEESRSEAEGVSELSTLMQESIDSGLLREQRSPFVSAIMGSLANITIQFVSRNPHEAEVYRTAGFDAFWNAVAKE